MEQLTVSTKGQVVIPIDIRQKLGIGPGSKVTVSIQGDDVLISREKTRPASDVRAGSGMLKYRGPKTQSLLDVSIVDLMRDEISRSKKK
jgi:antitoxin PrlF